MTGQRTLDDHLIATFVGRDDELAELRTSLEPHGPVVTFVHGLPGVGTTALLERFAVDARRCGATVIPLDCRAIEPTPETVRRVVRSAGVTVGTGGPSGEVAAPAAGRARTVVLLDHWSAFRLLDAWFRLELVPNLPPTVALVIASDQPPSPAWRASPDPSAAVRTLHLDVLPAGDALALLAQHGIGGDEAERILTRTRRLPLALQVAAATARSGVTDADEVGVAEVATVWADAYLVGVRPELRRALEAIAVARRGTATLVEAAVPNGGARLIDELTALPFVRMEDDGLAVHDAVRTPIVAGLKAVDPERHLAYRRAAWQLVERRLRTAARPTWRPMADLLHLIDHPLLHDAVFPASGPRPSVEPATVADLDQVAAIADAHVPPVTAQAIVDAARVGTGHLRVARTEDGTVEGFVTVLERTSLASDPVRDEPTVAAVRAHLHGDPVPSTQDVLIMPAVLSRGSGDLRDEITAALWIDLKRLYLERRDRLRRVYTVVSDLDGFLAAGAPLGFAQAVSPVRVDGVDRHVAVLDLGPGCVGGWLSRLAADQVGVAATGLELDADHRTATIGQREVVLSRLEFGVLEALAAKDGRPVSRAELIRTVWGHEYTGGSNVVDAVVRTVRRKLGDEGGIVQTVRGVGYRVAMPGGAGNEEAKSAGVTA